RLTMAQGAGSRWRLVRGLKAFDRSLRARTGGKGITVLRGEADEILPGLMELLGACRLHQTDWPTPEMRTLQDRVRERLRPLDARLIQHRGHLLVDPGKIRTGNGDPYRVYSPFARAVRRLGPDRPAPDAPARISAFPQPPEGLDLNTLNLTP